MKEFRFKKGDKILSIIKHFSATEKVILSLLITIAIISSFSIANKVNKYFLMPVPAFGGSFTEGIVGLPRSINPVLAFTDVDRDLSTLIYSGLLKYDNGKIIGDLAEKYTVSEDGLIYTFTLKDNIYFHDGYKLTTDDIEFTIQKVQDSLLKSPKRADWANVTIKKVSEKEIQFILKQPYSPFIVNTTIGILPKHIWKNVDTDQFIFSQYNIEPIGSGPYKLKNIVYDNGGIPQYYKLESFNKYYDKEPFINLIYIYFFSNEKMAVEALNNGTIENLGGISPQEAEKISSSTSKIKILSTPLPRIFGIFLNQNNAPLFLNKEIRQAMNVSLDKEKFIQKVLYGYGVSINSPLPPNNTQSNSKINENTNNKEKAKEILSKAGWVLNNDGILEKKDKKSSQLFEFSISTTDAPDLKLAAEIAKQEWESIGAKVNIKVFEYGDLSQNIIKTRKYDALLFGEYIGKDLDLYAFWHSSQRNFPGLNVSMYANGKIDKILEDARTILDEKQKDILYTNFENILQDEIPAIFLYSPEYIYIVPERIQGISLGSISNSSDRWYNINKWFTETENVWRIFVNN